MVIALIATAEAMLFSASGAKRHWVRRQQVLMGNSNLGSGRCLSLVDEYLRRKTAGASRVQVFIASKLTELCRRAVHTRSFEYLLLHLVRTSVLRRRSKRFSSQGRVTL
jgi:hypothetical protein